MIAILCTCHGEGLGAESVLEQCLRGWRSIDPPLMVVAPPHSRLHHVAMELHLSFVPLTSSRESLTHNLVAAYRIRKSLRGCQLVHAWTARAAEPSRLLAHYLGVPATATLHDHPQALFLSLPRRFLLKWSARKVNALVCVSDAVRQACIDCGYRTDLEVIRNGLADIKPERSPSDRTRVGFLGMYASWKGFEVVADWIEATRGMPVEWRLYGDLLASHRLQAERLARGSQGDVILCGRQRPESIFNELDILVHASTAFDPLPTVLIEAARAGLPVVASRLGGAQEIVTDGQTGMLFDPLRPSRGLDALQCLLMDEASRAAMGRAARQRYEEHFCVKSMTSAYASLWSMLSTPVDREQR